MFDDEVLARLEQLERSMARLQANVITPFSFTFHLHPYFLLKDIGLIDDLEKWKGLNKEYEPQNSADYDLDRSGLG